MSDKINIVKDLENLIKDGLINGYKENILFTQNYSDLQSRIIEYLIVVNVAKELKHYCIQNGIEINLEHSLNEFYNNAFPSVTFPSEVFGSEATRRKKHSPEDSKTKRLDIVLTSEIKNKGELGFASKKSLAGIEIKSINQSKKKIKDDIIRLSKALSLIDAVSKNNIKVGFVCFFRRFDKENDTMTMDTYKVRADKETKKWEIYFETIKNDYPKLNFNLSELNIVNLPVEEFKYHNEEIDYDFSEVAEKTGFINAYIIRIDRND